MAFDPENASFIMSDASEDGQANLLIKYLQKQPPEVLTRVAKSVSPEIRQIISQ
ncbi:MAG: DUF760 domain-containing protein, partial [Cyanobacteria bacterium P01_F01_bin.42]